MLTCIPFRRLHSTLLAAALGLLAPLALAEKTDVVVLVNGDHITGEVKELSYGQLKFKTDNMGTIYIEWDKIASVSTRQVLQVELTDGSRHVGRSPEPAPQQSVLRLAPVGRAQGESVVDLPMADIVRVAYLEQGRWIERLKGAISLGYSFTQASSIEQFNLSGNIGTRNSKHKWDISLDAQTTNQDNAPGSQRSALVGTFEKFMPNRYYYESTLEFTKNRELGLDLRTLLGATYGRYLVQNQGREWRAGAGLAASQENLSDGTQQENLEAQLTTSFRMFRYDSPKRDVTVNLTLLPSLSDSGRVRGEASIDARYEIVSDLFFEISLYDSYDNEPPDGSKSNDWSLVTSLGYSF